MAIYQCPNCLGVHEEAAEPVLGLFVRCEACLLEAWLETKATSGERLAPEPAEAVAA